MLRLLKLWALALLLAVPVTAAEINDFDPTDANNIARWPEGMPFANVNDAGRADEGILARFWKDINGSLTTAGSSNAYTIAANQTFSAYYTGMWVRAKASFTSTGSATLNVDSLGAITLKKANGANLASGDIVSGTVYDFVHDGTNFQVLQLNSLSDAIVTTAKIADSAVTSVKIADGTITSSDIADGTILWGDLAQTIFNQSGTSPATGDLIPFADISDSGNRKVATIANILGLSVAGSADFQRFNSSGTWNKPSGSLFDGNSRVLIRAWGGGGSGGANTSAAGGGGGGCSERWMLLSELGSTVTVTIGSGGAGASGNGNAGSNTTFGSHLTAYGGGAGDGAGTVEAGGGGGGPLSAGGTGVDAQGVPGDPLAISDVGANKAQGQGGNGTTGWPAIYHGGGGGDQGSAGGDSLNCGGGGGGRTGGAGGAGGVSVNGGNGGAGSTGATGTAGTQPGGGGGAGGTTSGAGGNGRVDVTVFPVSD